MTEQPQNGSTTLDENLTVKESATPKEKKTVAKKSSQQKAKKVTAKKANDKKNSVSKPTKSSENANATNSSIVPNYPRHSLDKSLRIPKAIIEQNAGKECSEKEAANFTGLINSHGPFRSEVSSSIKYGFLERPNPTQIKPTELTKKILRPQSPEDELIGYRQAILRVCFGIMFGGCAQLVVT